MFAEVIKKKWRPILILVVSMFLMGFICMPLIFGLVGAMPQLEPEAFYRIIKVSLVMGGFGALLAFLVSYMMQKENVEADKRVLNFSKIYKVGDKFWALDRYLKYDPGEPRTVFNNIYHFKVEEINFKKGYYKLSEEFRPRWEPKLTGLSRYLVFKSKDGLLTWLKNIKKDYEKWENEINSIIKGVEKHD